MRAAVESFDTDGLTLGYTTTPAEDCVVQFLALGGASVEREQVGWTSSRSSSAGAVGGLCELASTDVVLLVPVPAETGAITRDLTVGFGARSSHGAAMAGYTCSDGARPGAVVGAQRRGDAFEFPGEDDRSRHCYLSLAGPRARVGTDVSPAGSRESLYPSRISTRSVDSVLVGPLRVRGTSRRSADSASAVGRERAAGARVGTSAISRRLRRARTRRSRPSTYWSCPTHERAEFTPRRP